MDRSEPDESTWTPPPPNFHEFLDQVLAEVPEFRAIVDEQLELADGEYYATRFFDAFSSAVMERQGRVMDGTATQRDGEIVERWLALGEQAMREAFVANAFLETAGDDFLIDPRGQALHDQLGPHLRQALEARRLSGDNAHSRYTLDGLRQNGWARLSDGSYALRLSTDQLARLMDWAAVTQAAVEGRSLQLEPGDEWVAEDGEIYTLLLRAHPDYDPDDPSQPQWPPPSRG